MSLTTIRSERPRSRGRVRCSVCSRIISRGVRYMARTNVCDGDIWVWRECDDCGAVGDYVWDWAGPWRLYEEGVGPEDWHEWATDALDMALWPPPRTLDERAEILAEADREHPLTGSDEAWAALMWRGRTCRAIRPEAAES